MNKLSTIAGLSLVLMSLSTAAFALNPQPEPPGKNIVLHMPARNVLLTGAQSSGRADADDNYCGTKVPGLPHVGGGVSGGGRFSDADDNYCGTKVPGHFGGVMLNPQPLPPRVLQGTAQYR